MGTASLIPLSLVFSVLGTAPSPPAAHNPPKPSWEVLRSLSSVLAPLLQLTLPPGHPKLRPLVSLWCEHPSVSTLATDPHTWGASLCPQKGAQTHRGRNGPFCPQAVHGAAAACLSRAQSPSPAKLGSCSMPYITQHRSGMSQGPQVAPSRDPALSPSPGQPLPLTAPRGFFRLLEQRANPAPCPLWPQHTADLCHVKIQFLPLSITVTS